MLVLNRYMGESIIIDDDIKITFLNLNGKQMRIGIDAPKNKLIYREELYKRIKNLTEHKRLKHEILQNSQE